VSLHRLPLRARLVVGFVAAMVVVLVGAGAFVFWRVQFALDHRLEQDLRRQTSDLREAATRQTPAAAIASLRGEAREAQLLTADGRVLASGPALSRRTPLLTPAEAERASRAALRIGRGHLISRRGRHLAILAMPVRRGARPGAVAATAIQLDQRDEALRELLAQLAVANLLALALASGVGYRLARAALDPVERYRTQADQIAAGATGVRLDIPTGPQDEISRLGATLNAMIDAQERAAERQRQFIDDASHELRTPLTTLSAEIDLALRKPRSAEQYQDTLHRIAGDTASLVDLAEGLLTLGAVGSTRPDITDIPARELLERAAGRARTQLTGDRAVVVAAPPDLRILGDEALLDRAIGNVVDNACRHGEGTVTLTAEALTAAGAAGFAARVVVHDEGAGMPGEFVPHAAERFRQDEVSRTGPGAGLGLSLVDAIVTAHDGQLRICSAGVHHCQPTIDVVARQVRCGHPDDGTAISLLVPATKHPLAS